MKDKIIIEIDGGDRWDLLAIVAAVVAVLVYF